MIEIAPIGGGAIVRAPLERLPFVVAGPPGYAELAASDFKLAELAADASAVRNRRGIWDAPEILVPASSVYQLERSDHGVVVYAAQRALNATIARPENRIAADRVYGLETVAAVEAFQERKGLSVDGKFGPLTSRAMAVALEPKVKALVPAGLVRGLVEGESGGLIGAINASVPGGRDCSYCQRRVLENAYADDEVVRRAFDPRYQMNLFASRLRERKDAYLARPLVTSHEWAWRCSTLNHNYPALAEKITTVGVGGLSSYYTSPQPWVQAIGARMADGTPVQTPLGWGKFYALGAPEHDHPGVMVKYVSTWIP
jgi:hypothetical protein